MEWYWIVFIAYLVRTLVGILIAIFVDDKHFWVYRWLTVGLLGISIEILLNYYRDSKFFKYVKIVHKKTGFVECYPVRKFARFIVKVGAEDFRQRYKIINISRKEYLKCR